MLPGGVAALEHSMRIMSAIMAARPDEWGDNMSDNADGPRPAHSRIAQCRAAARQGVVSLEAARAERRLRAQPWPSQARRPGPGLDAAVHANGVVSVAVKRHAGCHAATRSGPKLEIREGFTQSLKPQAAGWARGVRLVGALRNETTRPASSPNKTIFTRASADCQLNVIALPGTLVDWLMLGCENLFSLTPTAHRPQRKTVAG